MILCDSSQNIFLLLLSQTSLSQMGRNGSIMGMVLCPRGDLPDHFTQMATFLTAWLSWRLGEAGDIILESAYVISSISKRLSSKEAEPQRRKVC